jgi:L-methionine (R)-S-oxide reductase
MEPLQGEPSVRSSADYAAKLGELEAYLTGHWLTDFANFSAFVFHSLPRLNWAGFYLFDGTKLALGPFVGRPACTEIRPGRGVCGTAFSKREALLVPNVDEFPGHITCDTASRSELVLPLLINGECLGVLDLDSPDLARFTEADRTGLATWLGALAKKIPAETWRRRPWA